MGHDLNTFQSTKLTLSSHVDQGTLNTKNTTHTAAKDQPLLSRDTENEWSMVMTSKGYQSKENSTLFLNRRIANLEMTIITAQQNTDQPQSPIKGGRP